jgi:demethylmenaquinone methyltransferase/2-methoxy-6-polyprenyl-1,4-benzoquinol methylase
MNYDILKIFSSVAQNYDLMNDVMSLGVHTLWKRFFLNICPFQPHMTIVDFGTGTGDLIGLIDNLFPYLDLNLFGFDVCDEMISMAKKRYPNHQFLSKRNEIKTPVDGVLASFSLRNCESLQDDLKSICDILKPGGFLGVLEFFKMPTHSSYEWIHTLSHVFKQEFEYQYLVQSIQHFLSFDDFTKIVPLHLHHHQQLWPSFVQMAIFLKI